MGKLDGRTILITGAARGLGHGLAKRLAREGGQVGVADLNEEGALATAQAITADGGAALGIGVDVGERASVRAAIAAAVDEFGRLDVMFNNAGISQTQYFMDITEDDFNRIMRVNALGVLLGTQEAAKQMRRQGEGGKVINTASIAGKEGFPLFAHYCASKFAVVALTQAGARSLSEDSITVNAFCPGVVDTELWNQLNQESVRIGETERPTQLIEDFSQTILVGRASTPDDIAGLAIFLAGPDSDYITGQSINVDGGMLVH